MKRGEGETILEDFLHDIAILEPELNSNHKVETKHVIEENHWIYLRLIYIISFTPRSINSNPRPTPSTSSSIDQSNRWARFPRFIVVS